MRVADGVEDFYKLVRLVPRACGECVSPETAFIEGGTIAASPAHLSKLDPAQE